LQVSDRCTFFVGDLFTPLVNKTFDVIVSNPPYIPQEDIKNLEIDVKDYEPLSALTDNGDGLSFYKRLFSQGQEYLNDKGLIAVEVG
ncbi:protein-(glutamine-N5) methyltransferase, release factor-specific, partial [Acinetobacter baumannii]|nr:protein-(glutamine-N5) methyltransferase, release factor-specific [Acinetobacter baumannii]